MFQPQFRPCRRNSFTPYSYLQLRKRQAGQLLTSKEVASPGIYKYATEAETSRERDLKKMTRPPILFVVRSPRLRRGLRIFSPRLSALVPFEPIRVAILNDHYSG